MVHGLAFLKNDYPRAPIFKPIFKKDHPPCLWLSLQAQRLLSLKSLPG